jgi:hypothetical protein
MDHAPVTDTRLGASRRSERRRPLRTARPVNDHGQGTLCASAGLLARRSTLAGIYHAPNLTHHTTGPTGRARDVEGRSMFPWPASHNASIRRYPESATARLAEYSSDVPAQGGLFDVIHKAAQ